MNIVKSGFFQIRFYTNGEFVVKKVLSNEIITNVELRITIGESKL
ncbi:hypothetical protein QQ008_24075 [Fulvivirgaceae bacterium BMA10]|uniref:Uncharacterized protein n=1 Tax=Splendidivirga corallicola TaxID=3051826 RepID=A0ABT8KVS0_9BACT|nr:hypothetical protein [Fulvivirgaceae bacterium BMA10]